LNCPVKRAVFVLLAIPLSLGSFATAAPRPNIILAMADDMGWGDPGYNSRIVTFADGSPHPDQGWISTPTMDAMAANGLRFDRFYSASAVCSPTRASCLTGRNPFRVGVPDANSGRLGFDETPLSEVLSAAGYTCGHFGKWHLGSMTTLRSDSNRGGNASVYSAPWHHGYDVCFATESKVPTYHPYRKPNNSLALPIGFSDPNFYGTRYWTMPATWNQTSGEGVVVPVEVVNNATDGDDSKLLVDQAISFIGDAVNQSEPFFAVLWFHTPHKPMVDPDGVSGLDSSDALKDSIEDMDTALGRLRDELTRLGVRDNTMLWLTSDNGPENGDDSPNEVSTSRSIRSGRFLQRKRSLYDGGLRVPGILEWPDVVTTGAVSAIPAVTSDYYPTILDYLQLSVPDQKPLDGVSLRPVIEGTATARSTPIGFKYGANRSWLNQRYKLIDTGSGWELYDMEEIPAGQEAEQAPIATAANIGSEPLAVQDIYNTMLAEFTAWNSAVGSDTPYVHASRPEVSLSTAAGPVTGDFDVSVTFSEVVSQLYAEEFTITNGTASALSGSGMSWTLTVSPSPSGGDPTIQLPEGAAIDPDGSLSAASNLLTVTNTAPSAPDATLSGPATTTGAYQLTITFSEPVTGLETTDFQITNGSASGISGSGGIYSVLITPASVGDVTVLLPSGSVTDLDDGLSNTASNSLVTTVGTAPSVLSGGDFNQPISQYNSTDGNSLYRMDSSLNVTENGADTGIDANEWVWSTLSRGFQYDPNGGAAGQGGAFVSYTGPDSFNQKPRGVIQFATGGQSVAGVQEIRMDVQMQDNSAANPLLFNLEVYAWNTGQVGPGLSLGGPNANDPTYNQTILGDAATLLKTQISASDLPDSAWNSLSVGNIDLGVGYDFYAWRIGVQGATDGDDFAFDNISLHPLSVPLFKIDALRILSETGALELSMNTDATGLVPQHSEDLSEGSFVDVDPSDFSVEGNLITIDSSVLTPPSDFFRVRD
jgi:arylsulfatase A-like enzyme